MDQGKLRYRIVGGVVLLALLAILVPVLNDVRQPLPEGPRAIDIPAEPADGLTAQVPTDGMAPDDMAPQPQDVPDPLPAPPLTEEDPAPDSDPVEPPALENEPEPARPAPVMTPKPAPPKPAAPLSAKPAAKPMTAAPAPPVAKPEPAPKPPVAAPAKPAPVVKAAPKDAPAPPPGTAAKPPAPSPAAPVTAPAAQQAWVVQLGVYGNVKTAIDLRETLRKAGHSAFTEEVVTPHGKALRVRVGPDLDRAAAQALRDRLARETGHDGIVMAYP